MDTLCVISIEQEFDGVMTMSGPASLHAIVRCESSKGTSLIFHTDDPTKYHVGDKVDLAWRRTPNQEKG